MASITQAALMTDLEYRVVAWNDEAEALYGWTREEVLGRPLWEAVQWVESEAHLLASQRVLERDGRWAGRVRLAHRDGTVFTTDAVVQVIHDHEGRPLGIVGIHATCAEEDVLDDAAEVLLRELEVGIDQGQLVIAYQPIVDAGGAVAKVEALVRWAHPERGACSCPGSSCRSPSERT